MAACAVGGLVLLYLGGGLVTGTRYGPAQHIPFHLSSIANEDSGRTAAQL